MTVIPPTPAIVPKNYCDIFISYMQNDHKYDGWVAGFLTRLQQELEATLKGRINIYSEENPHTRLSETYNVSQSLAEKKFIT